MKCRVALTIFGIAMSGAAHAQTTNHFHVEGVGGWDDLVAHAKYTDLTTGDVTQARAAKGGATYGVGTGFDFESASGLAFGPIASIMWSSTKSCSEVDGGDAACLKSGRELEAGARVGQRYSEHGALAYVKIAYVNMREKASYSDGVISVSAHQNVSGIRAGIGLEQPVTQHFYIKAEYRYTDFKDSKLSDDVETVRTGLERHQVVAGVGVSF